MSYPERNSAHPVWTGPYCLATWERGSKETVTLVLVRSHTCTVTHIFGHPISPSMIHTEPQLVISMNVIPHETQMVSVEYHKWYKIGFVKTASHIYVHCNQLWRYTVFGDGVLRPTVVCVMPLNDMLCCTVAASEPHGKIHQCTSMAKS